MTQATRQAGWPCKQESIVPGDVIFRFALMFYDTRAEFGNQSRDVAGSGLVANTAGFREQSRDGTAGVVSANAGCYANRLLKHSGRIIATPVANQRSIWDLRPFRVSRGGPGSGGQEYCSVVSAVPIRLPRCQFPRPSFSGPATAFREISSCPACRSIHLVNQA